MQPDAHSMIAPKTEPPRGENTVTVLTAQAAGAIAVVRLEGSLVELAIRRRAWSRSGQPIEMPPGPRQRLVHWDFGGPEPEEAVLYRPSDHALEIHCHGGARIVENIVRAAETDGFLRRLWESWVSDQEADPIAAAARIALSHARTTRTANILLDQYHGALRAALREIAAGLETGQPDAARRLNRLCDRASLGRHLLQPWRVVIFGPPNVGKSSILNALSGYGRAIVHPSPGTTRDLVSSLIVADGWPIELIDTAGLRSAEDPVESLGVQKAHAAARQADLVILVFDRSQPWTPDNDAILSTQPGALLIHNKADLPPALGYRPPGLEISALRSSDVSPMLDAVVRRLVPQPPLPGEAVPFTEEEIAAVEEARAMAGRSQEMAASRLRRL